MSSLGKIRGTLSLSLLVQIEKVGLDCRDARMLEGCDFGLCKSLVSYMVNKCNLQYAMNVF